MRRRIIAEARAEYESRRASVRGRKHATHPAVVRHPVQRKAQPRKPRAVQMWMDKGASQAAAAEKWRERPTRGGRGGRGRGRSLHDAAVGIG